MSICDWQPPALWAPTNGMQLARHASPPRALPRALGVLERPRKVRMRNLLLFASIALTCTIRVPAAEPPFWPCESNDGAPFGHLTDSDEAKLISLASAGGLDLRPTLEKVYAGDKEALASVLRLSSQLKSRDMPMRVYGNMVYSIFLNLGEAKGPEFVISVVVGQEPAVRQRIRDFLWYPVFCVPKEQRAEAEKSGRTEFPLLWPPDFVFGKDDPLFSKTPNNAFGGQDYRHTSRRCPILKTETMRS
jgi:hypothetical protein